MKRKGFTLIELLAVIVILAIIALIAVPVIMNIITSARESAFEDTAYGLISAGEMYYARELLENGMASDVEFTIEDGEFVGENKLEVKGALPTKGKIKVTSEGKVALAISNGAMCITKGYDDSKIDPEADLDNCELPKEPAKTLSELAKTNDFATIVHACTAAGTTCTTGEKFAIEVAPGNIQNFYVVSDVNNTVTLIMDRNLGENVPWISEVDYGCGSIGDYCAKSEKGPLTALSYLENSTSGWANIEVKNYTLTDSKYGTIERTNAKARMLTHNETINMLGCIEYANECPTWLYGNFWLSSSSTSNLSFAWSMNETGSVVDYHINELSYGVRPVIEISK